MRARILKLMFVLIALCTVGVRSSEAGCGCEKAPPDAAHVRPSVTYAGGQVALFHPSLKVGTSYTVRFYSGVSSSTATVNGSGVLRRDLADGVEKPHLVVTLPSLPLGPARIKVSTQAGAVVVDLADSAFTVAPQPIVMPTEVGVQSFTNRRFAIGRDGTFYLSLDLSAVTQARSYTAQALGYPAVFTSEDVVFYNVQGFLMQLFDKSMPGLFSVASANSPSDSDILGYRRHEFQTYLLQHGEKKVHQVDPWDPNWHIDGSRHIDHDHQILAIAAQPYGGAAAQPGQSPAFTLRLETSTLFDDGLFAEYEVDLEDSAKANSYDSKTGAIGLGAQLTSNREVDVENYAVLNGNVTAPTVNTQSGVTITGTISRTDPDVAVMPFGIPDLLDDLGAITLTSSQSRVIASGSYRVSSLKMNGNSSLNIDNSSGPVIFYVTDPIDALDIEGSSSVTASDPNPESFSVYVVNGGEVDIDENAVFYGVVYAPDSQFLLENSAHFYGAVTSWDANVSDNARFHYDTNLQSTDDSAAATCTGLCGGSGSDGSCWCDSVCSNYGDCCGDYADACSTY